MAGEDGKQPLQHSYVLLTYTGVKIEARDKLFYDDVASAIHSVEGGNVYTYTVPRSTSVQPAPEASPKVTPLGDGPPALLVLQSSDASLLACQRSPNHVEIVDCLTGNIFIQGPSVQRSSNVVCGFVWTLCPVCHFVLVTGAGLEMYKRVGGRGTQQGLRLADSRAHIVKWYCYNHDTRVLLMATGETGKKMQAYQFNSREVVKLPSFELVYPVGSAPLIHLAPQDVWLLNLYGRVYCAVLHRQCKKLLMYRFYKNTVILQHQYDVMSENVALTCEDSMLLLHYRDECVTLLLDVCHPSVTPLVNPLPVSIQLTHQEEQEESTQQMVVDLRSDMGARDMSFCNWLPHQSDVYRSTWWFIQANYILDTTNGCLYGCHVDLEALAHCCYDFPSLVSFLQRRSPTSDKPRQLTLGVIKEALLAALPLTTVRPIFDAVNAALAQAFLQGVADPAAASAVAASEAPSGRSSPGSFASEGEGLTAAQTAPPSQTVVTAQEMAMEVFSWLHAQGTVDDLYLQAVLHLYCTSLLHYNLAVPPLLSCQLIDVLLRQGKHFQVCQLLSSCSGLDCAAVARHLAALWKQGALQQGLQLSLDMQQRLKDSSSYCSLLVMSGNAVEAVQAWGAHQDSPDRPRGLTAAVRMRNSDAIAALLHLELVDKIWQLHPVWLHG